MICHRTKSIFIHICRCGGTSVELFLDCDPVALNQNNERHALPSRYEDHWNKYFTFVIVRNPWDRLCSAFRYTVERGLQDTEIKRRLHAESGGSINKFVKRVLSQPRLLQESVDRLFWPQTRWLVDAEGRPIPFDRVIRFESLQEEVFEVAHKLGIFCGTLPAVNGTRGSDYHDVYDREAAAIVEEIYRDDIRMLGYRF